MGPRPPVLGADDKKLIKGGAKGPLPAGTARALSRVSGISIGGVSGVSDESLVGGMSLCGALVHPAHAAHTRQSPAEFRRAGQGHQYNTGGEGDHLSPQPPGLQHGGDGAQRTQDTSQLGRTLSTQATTEDMRMTGTTAEGQLDDLRPQASGGLPPRAAGAAKKQDSATMRHPVLSRPTPAPFCLLQELLNRN